MDAVAATAAASATITSLESQLRELVTSALAKSPTLGSRLRDMLYQLADIPQGQVIDEETLDDFRSDAQLILRRVCVWVSDLQQHSQQRDHAAPLVGSDSTPNTPNTSNTLASLLFRPDGSPKSPVDATRFVHALHSQIFVFMRAETIELPPTDLDLFIQILPFTLPEASTSSAHSLALDTNGAPCLTPNRVRSDFLLPFHGRLVHMLQAYILNANRYIRQHHMHVYSKCFPILQSSGTGKSKLAVQLSACQAGFLVCTRSPHPSSVRDHISFPPNDDSVYAFLFPVDSDPFQHHRRIACWLGAYFAVLAYSLEKCLLASGCFDGLERPPRAPAGYHSPPNPTASGSSAAPAAITTTAHDLDTSVTKTVTCKHSNPHLCWHTAVFHLALAIHDGPDFISTYRFSHSDEENGLQFCPSSHLDLAACNDPDDSFPEPATVLDPSSIDSDMQRNEASSAGEDMPPPPMRPSSPLDTRRFRTYLLGKIAKIAQEEFAKSDSGPLQDETGAPPSAQSMPNLASERYMQPHLKRLESLLPESLHNSHFFFLVIDEVMPIQPALPVLRRLWAEAAPRFTWLMFIDTDSKVAPLAGPRVRLASARLDVNEQLMVIPPFSRLGFDAVIQHKLEILRQPLLSGQLTFGRLLDILSCFGRPLWSTNLYRSVDHPRRPHVANILVKLLAKEQWPVMWPEAMRGDLDFADPASSFFKSIMAIAGQRLPLRFVGHQGVQLHKGTSTTSSSELGKSAQAFVQSESIRFLQAQASHHLRVISKVRDNINFFKTSTVSEPALSLSVASLLRGLTVSDSADSASECASKWSCIIKVLSHAHRAVGLMLGEEGEEGVRLLLSMAADLVASQRVEQLRQMAVGQQQGNQTTNRCLVAAQCDPICLRDWLNHLFGKQNLDSKLRWWASHYHLNFTHYLRLSTYVYSDKQHRRLECNALVEYWMRQVAFYGLDKQPGWDLVIPIYRSDHTPTNSDLFNPANLSYVAIQVKNCKSDIKATRFFGPALRSSSDGGLDLSILQNGCLEIFVDLRSPKVMHWFEVLEPTGDEKQQAPLKRLHLTVGGSDAQSLPLINCLTDEAFGFLKLLLGHVEADTTLDAGRARLDQALNAGSPHKEEFERLQSIIDGDGPAYLWEAHRNPTRRSTTGIPWAKKRPAGHIDDNSVNDANDDDVAMASAQDG